MRVGNKMNSFLNGEWAKHGGRGGKKYASKARRQLKDLNKEERSEIKGYDDQGIK